MHGFAVAAVIVDPLHCTLLYSLHREFEPALSDSVGFFLWALVADGAR